VIDNSQYPNLEAWPTTPLSGYQKEWPTTPNTQTRRSGRQLLIPKPGGMTDNSTTRPPEGVADNSQYPNLEA